MRGKYQLKPKASSAPDADIFANKSGVVLEWLLLVGHKAPTLKIREVAQLTGVSLGLVQKIFHALVQKGWMKVDGLRTAKSFHLTRPHALLKAWAGHYRLMQKKRIYNYTSGLNSREEILEALVSSPLKKYVALALHSAAQNHERAFTNLKGVELYSLRPDIHSRLERLLKLAPQERGYDVLLVEPYYKSMLTGPREDKSLSWSHKGRYELHSSPPLLTYLDLNQFPLRGEEQAEYLLSTELKRLHNNG